QLGAVLLEDLGEHRDDEPDHRQEDEHGERQDDGRVDHRRPHLAAQLVLGLEMVGDADERRLEEAAGFARTDHRDVEDAEDLGLDAQHGQAALPQLLGDRLDRRALELAPDRPAQGVDGAEREDRGAHRTTAPLPLVTPAPWPMTGATPPPSSRPSSSALPARWMASSRVILPLRTSSASAA